MQADCKYKKTKNDIWREKEELRLGREEERKVREEEHIAREEECKAREEERKEGTPLQSMGTCQTEYPAAKCCTEQGNK